MTTETDDLNYYEHELPKVIAGVRRGEKWERKHDTTQNWFAPADQSQTNLFDYIRAQGYRVRLAPVPVVKFWDCGGDLPGASVWLRWKTNPKYPMMAIGLTHVGIQYMGKTALQVAHWSEMPELEYSTDLQNWSDCVKPEGGK